MDLRGARIAVTGATGFLGRYIVDVLHGRGAHVVGVVRNPERVPDLVRRGVEMRRADLADRAALARGFAGADAVVSNAALWTLRSRDWDAHQTANVQGTRNVCEALADAGVRRIVHVSSVAVYRDVLARGLNEDAPQLTADTPRGFMNAYAVSKAVSEQVAWEHARRLRLDLTTLRPCAIYGAHDPNFMPIFRAIAGLPLTVWPVWLRLPLVYAGDVAEAVALALETPRAIGRAYNVTGDDGTLWEFARAWGVAGGRTAWLTLPLPLPVGISFDHSRASRELGWRNRSYEDGLRDTLARERGGDSSR
jgi:nucleoside-diphosphate-sugar epimerase